jgi:predicted DNA-binding protein YlxM (UPF0122 family)
MFSQNTTVKFEDNLTFTTKINTPYKCRVLLDVKVRKNKNKEYLTEIENNKQSIYNIIQRTFSQLSNYAIKIERYRQRAFRQNDAVSKINEMLNYSKIIKIKINNLVKTEKIEKSTNYNSKNKSHNNEAEKESVILGSE